jgi:predicted HAD superfamily Cof-like phosphohydrolase
MSVFADQAAFMRACGQTTDHDNEQQAYMYEMLCDEERQEWMEANPSAEEDIDAVIDQIVVLIGYGLSRGWDMDGAWREVVRSNMSKVDPVTGMVTKREDGKILKPAHFSPPSLAPYLKRDAQ